MEAMKWEARIENAFVQFGNWYLNGRGWGDLAEGTALFWAVPYQERWPATTRPRGSMAGVMCPKLAATKARTAGNDLTCDPSFFG